jgi:hypothetical protein
MVSYRPPNSWSVAALALTRIAEGESNISEAGCLPKRDGIVSVVIILGYCPIAMAAGREVG